MKLLYFFLFVFGLLLTGYLVMNDFGFDNSSFSNYLINTLFICLMSTAAIAGLGYFIASRRKNAYKDIMTIRQYYDYRSAR
jgi:ABC-type Fe3+ transport system permease subunit